MTEDHSEGQDELCNSWCFEIWGTIFDSSLEMLFTIQKILNARILPYFSDGCGSLTLCRRARRIRVKAMFEE